MEKVKSILESLELIDARLRYNEAFKEEISTSNQDELRSLFYNFDPVLLIYINKHDSSSKGSQRAIEIVKTKLLEAADSDINDLKQIREVIVAYSQNEVPISVLHYSVNILLSWETKQMNETVKNNSGRRQSRSKLEEDNSNNRQNSEYYTYTDLISIFKAAQLFGDKEAKFIHTYTEFKVSRHTDETYYILTPQFERFVGKLKNAADELTRKLQALSDFHSELVKELQVRLNHYKNLIAIDCFEYLQQQNSNSHLKPDQNNLLHAYDTSFLVNDALKEISQLAESAAKEDSAWKKQQQEQELLKEKMKREDNKQKLQKQKKSAQAAKLESKAAARNLELEKEKQKVELAAKLQAERAAEATSKEDRRINDLKWKQTVEARRIQLKAAENAEREQFVKNMSSKPIMYSDNGIIKSRFSIPTEIIEDNKAAILELLSVDCKAISYKKAVTLIERLGGKVDVTTGSSHQKIIFDGSVYQFLEEPEQGKHVTGLYRPHGNETELKKFELRLLKDVLQSILPEGFLAALHGKTPNSNKSSGF